MSVCWINGKFVPREDASISIFDHGVLYGDGIFEGIRFYQRKAFLLEAHLTRLAQSAAVLQLTLPYCLEDIQQAIEESIKRSSTDHGYLRIVVTRGEGSLGIDPTSCLKANMFIIGEQLTVVNSSANEAGIRVIISSWRRIPNDSLDSRIKSLNYLNQILARLDAKNANADEAILLNHAGFVTEASVENIFIVKNKILMTPPAIDGALDGVTRKLILDLAHQLGIHASEKSMTPYDLYTSDECFLTGTGSELVPVKSVDGRSIQHCPGPIFKQLQNAFHQITYGEINND